MRLACTWISFNCYQELVIVASEINAFLFRRFLASSSLKKYIPLAVCLVFPVIHLCGFQVCLQRQNLMNDAARLRVNVVLE
jgi:hypothetical protein